MSLRILLIICVCIGLFISFYSPYIERFIRDVSYKYYHEQYPFWKSNVNKNEITKIRSFPTRICIITLETRNAKYIDLHNQNIRNYIQHKNALQNGNVYTYIFTKECNCSIPHNHNPYWCKMFLVQELLYTNTYDFVLWMDSDTVFTNFQPDLADILQSYESHIYCSTDFGDHYTICAGVFAFRNSTIGKRAIKMITDYYNSKPFQQMCVPDKEHNKNNKLSGKWAQTCYEQGAMNNILYKYFKPYLTILDSSIIQNDIECHAKFILHYFDMSSEERETCFVKFSKLKQN